MGIQQQETTTNDNAKPVRPKTARWQTPGGNKRSNDRRKKAAKKNAEARPVEASTKVEKKEPVEVVQPTGEKMYEVFARPFQVNDNKRTIAELRDAYLPTGVRFPSRTKTEKHLAIVKRDGFLIAENFRGSKQLRMDTKTYIFALRRIA